MRKIKVYFWALLNIKKLLNYSWQCYFGFNTKEMSEEECRKVNGKFLNQINKF